MSVSLNIYLSVFLHLFLFSSIYAFAYTSFQMPACLRGSIYPLMPFYFPYSLHHNSFSIKAFPFYHFLTFVCFVFSCQSLIQKHRRAHVRLFTHINRHDSLSFHHVTNSTNKLFSFALFAVSDKVRNPAKSLLRLPLALSHLQPGCFFRARHENQATDH